MKWKNNEIYFKEYRISDVLAAVKRYRLDSDEAFFPDMGSGYGR